MGLPANVFTTFTRALVSQHFLSRGEFTPAEIISETASRSSQSPEAISTLAQQVIAVFTHLAVAPASQGKGEALKARFKLEQAIENSILALWTELGAEVQRAVASQRQWNSIARSSAWTVDVKMLGRRTEMLNEPECTVRVLTTDATVQFSLDKAHLEDLVTQLEAVESQAKSLVFKS